ncbi:RNA polymerase sigma factor [Opitutaceae bacterium]
MPPQNSEQARWFAHHLQPHESMLRAWLRRRFPSGCDIDDIVQESYLRVLQARESGTLQSPKAFLFATARNFALNGLRRRRQTDAAALEGTGAVPATVRTGEEALVQAQELALLKAAVAALPERCRQIFVLRKIEGLSQREVAARLGISEHTVEAQGTIGLRKITEFLERAEREGRP